MNKTFAKHLAAIKAGRIERSNIIGIRKAFNAYTRNRLGYSNGRTSPIISTEEFNAANAAISQARPTVAGELKESGLKVLRNPRYAKRWTPREQRIIDNFRLFELVRFEWLRATHCVPVYRVVSQDRESFAFRNIPWQAAWAMNEKDGPCVVEDDD